MALIYKLHITLGKLGDLAGRAIDQKGGSSDPTGIRLSKTLTPHHADNF